MLPHSNEEFFHQLGRHLRSSERFLAYLNFGLFIIFNKHIFFDERGMCGEIDNRRMGEQSVESGGWVPSDDYTLMASGVVHCAKIIVGVLAAPNKSIVLLDEPEAHLEPRICRRMFQFLVWLFTYTGSEDDMTETELTIRRDISSRWKVWKPMWGQTHYTYRAAEEGGLSEDYREFGVDKQLFVASHSSVLIDEHLALQDSARIYEFDSKFMDNRHDRNAKRVSVAAIAPDWADIESLFSAVRLVRSLPHSILDNLGCKGSDLLQSNGIVWVEGPSDVVYIQSWINMHLAEKGVGPLRRGIDFEFQMFGGALLDSFYLLDDDVTESETAKKLVEMLSFSRNAFVVVDSDAIEQDGMIRDQSKFAGAKTFIKSGIMELQQKGYAVGMWFEELNPLIRTLEDYLDEATLEEFGTQADSAKSKKAYAQVVTASWQENGRSLGDFPHNLEARIDELVSYIRQWNEFGETA